MNMPFVSICRPAIGISLLKARLIEEGFDCATAYPNLGFAEVIGLDRYTIIDESLSLALFPGEWLFAQYLFGDRLDIITYLATVKHNSPVATHFEALMEARELVQDFLKNCIEVYDIATYDIIGFTSTFQQNLASLALAKHIKKLFPEKITIMGGGNCEGIMGQELIRNFSWIDYIISGEADQSLPKLLKRLQTHQSLDNIPGLIIRQDGAPLILASQDKIHDLDGLPDPDFQDYFTALANSRLKDRLRPSLPFESSRGCWWGEKSRCTFCGLNGETIGFRCKSAERILEELQRQLNRYQIKHFQAVDNIFSKTYFETLLPALKKRNLGIKIFYETRSNIKPDQVKLMQEAGVYAVQPGVESLNTNVLKIMRKGVTALENIQLLKACREHNVEATWNLLYGFPGENEEDYAKMAALIPSLYHLRPPGAVSTIRLDRFSHNFNNAKVMGFTNVKPFSMYNFIYPLAPEAIANIAYFFEYQNPGGLSEQVILEKLQKPIKTWKENKDGSLVKKYGQDPELIVIETRPGHPHKFFPFNGIQREIYDFCNEIQSRRKILEFAAKRTRKSIAEIADSLDQFLFQMVELDLMVREGDCFLSLAIAGDIQYKGLNRYQKDNGS